MPMWAGHFLEADPLADANSRFERVFGRPSDVAPRTSICATAVRPKRCPISVRNRRCRSKPFGFHAGRLIVGVVRAEGFRPSSRIQHCWHRDEASRRRPLTRSRYCSAARSRPAAACQDLLRSPLLQAQTFVARADRPPAASTPTSRQTLTATLQVALMESRE
jgi:hypothetical protein